LFGFKELDCIYFLGTVRYTNRYLPKVKQAKGTIPSHQGIVPFYLSILRINSQDYLALNGQFREERTDFPGKMNKR